MKRFTQRLPDATKPHSRCADTPLNDRCHRCTRQPVLFPHHPPPATRHPLFRRGLTLFEVLISLAIFVGSMAAIGQLVATGVRGALRARLQTQAVLRCESKMAEVVAGISPFHPASDTPFVDDPAWTWSMSLAPGPNQELFLVEVTTAHQAGGQLGAVTFSLRRLVRNPQIFIDKMIKEQEQQATQSATSGAGT